MTDVWRGDKYTDGSSKQPEPWLRFSESAATSIFYIQSVLNKPNSMTEMSESGAFECEE